MTDNIRPSKSIRTSTTTIIGTLWPMPDIPAPILNDAANIGTLMHNELQKKITGRCDLDLAFDDIEWKWLSLDTIEQYRESYEKLKTMQIDDINEGSVMEEKFTLELPEYGINLVGKVDLYNRKQIIDFKTTSKKEATKVTLQLNIYKYILQKKGLVDDDVQLFMWHYDKKEGILTKIEVKIIDIFPYLDAYKLIKKELLFK